MRKRLTIALAALTGLALTFSGSAQPPAKVQHLSSITWSEEFEAFGGVSALELADNGRDFLAISDRMHLMQGQLIRENGQISAVELSRHEPLNDAAGITLKPWKRDSEGLAVTPNGTLFVSLEAINQVWRYNQPFGQAKALPRHPDFQKMPNNAALEALAIDGRGRLYTVPEVRPKSRPGLPLYRYSSKGWQILYYIDVQEGFDPVAADFGPDGQFYMLERKFGGIGFRSRLRRFDLGSFDPKGEHLLTTALGQHDNLEGLSVWRDPQGQTRLTMVSDDNFKFFQRSEIVEYVLTETLAKAAATH